MFRLTFLISFILLLSISPVSAVLVDLDLQGTGETTAIELPFKYYERKPNDKFTLIFEFGYKIYDLKEKQNENEIAVIGPLYPCIGIAVTDGKKLIVFHKHALNTIDTKISGSLGQIVRDNLDLNPQNPLLQAGICTTKEEIHWRNNVQFVYGGKTIEEAIQDIKDTLIGIGIPQKSIHSTIWNLRIEPDNKFRYQYPELGKYQDSELFVALRIGGSKQIEFRSLDPITENIFDLKPAQYFESSIEERKYYHEKIKQLRDDFRQKTLSTDNMFFYSMTPEAYIDDILPYLATYYPFLPIDQKQEIKMTPTPIKHS